MYNGLVTHPTLPGFDLVREDIKHPSNKERCDLIRNKTTGIYATTDGTSVRSISQRVAREIAAKKD